MYAKGILVVGAVISTLLIGAAKASERHVALSCKTIHLFKDVPPAISSACKPPPKPSIPNPPSWPPRIGCGVTSTCTGIGPGTVSLSPEDTLELLRLLPPASIEEFRSLNENKREIIENERLNSLKNITPKDQELFLKNVYQPEINLYRNAIDVYKKSMNK